MTPVLCTPCTAHRHFYPVSAFRRLISCYTLSICVAQGVHMKCFMRSYRLFETALLFLFFSQTVRSVYMFKNLFTVSCI